MVPYQLAFRFLVLPIARPYVEAIPYANRHLYHVTIHPYSMLLQVSPGSSQTERK